MLVVEGGEEEMSECCSWLGIRYEQQPASPTVESLFSNNRPTPRSHVPELHRLPVAMTAEPNGAVSFGHARLSTGRLRVIHNGFQPLRNALAALSLTVALQHGISNNDA